ncbi:bifunctional 4-hydroxy-2-oxoglutarate aldolase/2-dehydro-3-deoxy-phosphogluconate aldolase [Agromyces silvae]|uniref:bifunctional 4-hydroxy-2-oxoglutarate aldolase/2-dehydro-3-deoxy-phosphogluconate aldolase n=1 Tax=Agromyces silvae TaxID=3388266 RepID=UPI00280C2D0A|nr:bifunctional 4-hydroxy-2-oxoglutarate aldolase/2-dehydro-3-deoxy-phosphogluconate aldolase [Agromyces protaetiae]
MFTKLERLKTIDDTGVVLIVRLDDPEEAYSVAEAAIEGGIRALEITYSVPGALGLIERLASRHRHEGVVIGAGTVLDGQAAFAAIQAGAELLVSPQLNPEMLATAQRYQAVSMSGAFTPTEIVDSVTAGADIVKLFPAEFVGPAYVKTVLAPLAGVPIAPAGGVTEANVAEWFEAGVCSVGVGSAITKAARGTGDYTRVVDAARGFLAAVAQARA